MTFCVEYKSSQSPCVRNQARKVRHWHSRDLLVKLKSKMETHRQWKQEQVSQEEYRDLAQLCRGLLRKAKALLVLTLVRNAKNCKKSFYRCVSQKRNVSVPCQINMTGKLVTGRGGG